MSGVSRRVQRSRKAVRCTGVEERNFRITLEYDGSGFAGWQRQPGKRTVQGEVEKALSIIAGKDVRVVCAGRTDSGAHACGQVISARLKWKVDPGRLAMALNAILPEDVAAVDAALAGPGFDARKDAVERAYRYAILCRDAKSPLLGRFCWRVGPPLNTALMRRAATLFRGKRNFKAFCAGEGRKWLRRKVSSIRINARGPFLTVDIAANSFLRHMVRMIVGAIVGAGKGRVGLKDIETALKSASGPPVAKMAPSRGLALLWVRYRGEKPGKVLNWPPLLVQ